MFKKVFLALMTAGLLAGCAAKGPAFTEAPSAGAKALVYLYRPYNKAISTQDAGFDVDEKRIGFLNPGGYTFFHAAPGQYAFKQFWPFGLWTIQAPEMWQSIKLPVELKAGETRYFRFSTNMGPARTYDSIGTIEWQFAEVPADAARQEIAQQKFEPQAKTMPAEFRP